jgi:hypothetical protein
MEQREVQQQEQDKEVLTFRDYVDTVILFGCIPALVLSMVLWAVATTFSHVGILPNVLALLVTLLLSFVALVLVIRYVDITVVSARKYNESASLDDGAMFVMLGAGAFCVFLAVSIGWCLSQAGVLEVWHYVLVGVEVLFVGYQTWRVFLGRWS